ncbi:phosphonate ABC transporter, permease protein PhnE [Paralimibaculum aggregatum]|uniref:Phosphonate ABC transporter, permease protein PhnE n=1 Tax=Paralimibaculum aggregatum TaxID=3036245 RepID=A0ABQ6LPJ8_9RHOB|nr:phosphonate ABC transporter, permease protein PhnE [Limibaculum sp. NKW23]GMG83248.1 phosphonate ABC transporter, permease protein PhnE [Limibaculum sp. NKW23]
MTLSLVAPVDLAPAAARMLRRRVLLGFGLLALVIGYLVYAGLAFGIGDLIERARPERALLLGVDSVKHKVHVEQNLRRGGLEVSVEGERTATYDTPPDWVVPTGDGARIDLGDGYAAVIEGSSVSFTVPGYGTLRARAHERGVETLLPDGSVIARPVGDAIESRLADGTVIRHLPDERYETVTPDGAVIRHPAQTGLADLLPEGLVPDWASIREVKLDARPTVSRRLQITRTKIEVHRYFWGWENFWFPFDSVLNGYSWRGLWGLAMSDERIDPEISNAGFIFRSFWENPDWQHGHVFVALLETIMMAVLGTLTAVLLGLPLAFLAARNFTPSMAVRFAVRRVFDFVRGIDNLIWSLIFIRAFGLGPLTGALAIAITDTGTLGKLFSEALENIDNRQVEGVRATGAGRLQRMRFGVLPQILPVFISQTLYYLEANTRSATVIGALGAGGIGLVLVETMRTSKDWENTLYIISLTIVVVILMDQLSGWLRRRLIQGG